MAGPWEKYAGAGRSAPPAPPVGPWAKYARPKAEAPQEGDPEVYKSGPATQVAPDRPTTMSGTAAQFGVGAARGAINTAATVPFARDALSDVASWASQHLGASPETAQTIAQAVKAGFLVLPGGANPTGPQVIEDINAATRQPSNPKGILEREPQNMAEAYAGSIGEFLPGAAGPGGPLRKVAQVLVPAIASETAGQATKGTEMEPWARMAAGFAGGVTAAGRSPSVTRLASKAAPERAALKAQADALYDRLRTAGIKYDSNSYDLMVRNLATKMKKEGFRPKTSAKVTDSLEYVIEGMGKSPDYSDFEAMRKNAGGLLASADKEERKFGAMIVEALDDFAERSPLVTSGNVPSNAVAPLMKEARAVAQRNIKARTVEEAIEAARNAASGFENGLRIEFRKIINNPKRRAGFTPVELDAMREIVRGASAQNLAAQFGRLGIGVGTKTAKSAALPLVTGLGGGYAVDPITGLATVAAASGAKYLAAQNAEKIGDRTLKTVLSGKEAQRAALQTKRAEQLKIQLRRLLALDNVTREARSGLSMQPIPQQDRGDR
jgi:transglutaminase-like putative cysteine protease